jgi:hypothetical protein
MHYNLGRWNIGALARWNIGFRGENDETTLPLLKPLVHQIWQ